MIVATNGMKIRRVKKGTKSDMPIYYLNADGEVATGAVYTHEQPDNGEIVFFEILGSDNQRSARINGKKTYKRIFIRQVYPHYAIESERGTL